PTTAGAGSAGGTAVPPLGAPATPPHPPFTRHSADSMALSPPPKFLRNLPRMALSCRAKWCSVSTRDNRHQSHTKERRVPLNITHELAALRRLTPQELRARYAELFGERPSTQNKGWLRKRLAWRLQALAEGDLSQRARQRAAELANDADLRT